jgi:ribosomal-protein-alanine N-acetyltransferase
VLFRLYQPGDFAQLYAVEEQCFLPPLRFSRQFMRQTIQSSASATWIAEEQTEMAGFAIVEWSRQRGAIIAYIQTLEVHPNHRRSGIATELLRRLEASAEAAGAEHIWLHVDAENAAAIHLYRTNGYQFQGRQEHYYLRNRAAEIYVKALTPHSSSGTPSGESSAKFRVSEP